MKRQRNFEMPFELKRRVSKEPPYDGPRTVQFGVHEFAVIGCSEYNTRKSINHLLVYLLRMTRTSHGTEFIAVSLLLLSATLAMGELVRLEVTPQPFPEPASASVFVDAGLLLGSDEVTSPISGFLTVDLLPSAVNPTSAQITEMNLQIDNAVDFEVGGGFLIPRVSVSAGAGELKLNLVAPGMPGTIGGGAFDQFENQIAFEGTVKTSVQPEPFNLSEEDPIAFDFEDIFIQSDRNEVTTELALFTTMSIPIEAGILKLDIALEVDGSGVGQGSVPAAEYVWVASGGAASFDEKERWLRGTVPNTNSLPLARDSVRFPSGSTAAIDLNGTRRVQDVTANGSTLLSGGTIDFNGQLVLNENAALEIASDASIVSDSIIMQTGGGSLRLGGTASSFEVVDGSVEGQGTFEALTVGERGELRLIAGQTLSVTSDLTLQGSLAIDVASLDVGEIALVTAQQINSSELKTLTISDQSIDTDGSETYSRHIDGGLFAEVTLGTMAITVASQQALPGDTNADGEVNFLDFLQLANAFGKPGNWVEGDFDNNGNVDFLDFLALAQQFGSSPPVNLANVPEPAHTPLFVVGLSVFLGGRKRRNDSSHTSNNPIR